VWSPLRQEPEAPFDNATSRGLRREPPAGEPGDCKSRDSTIYFIKDILSIAAALGVRMKGNFIGLTLEYPA
jgi:hypothetical protein